jgi:effector-binding domain-containing protein
MSVGKVSVKQLAPVSVAVVRRRVGKGEIPAFVMSSCGKVWNHLKAQNIRGGHNIAIYWDGAIHVEAGVETDAPFAESNEVVRSATPSGTVASVTHFGPYNGLRAAHETIDKWCQDNGYRSGPQWEVYGHWVEEWNSDPSKIRTDVYHHVTRANEE